MTDDASSRIAQLVPGYLLRREADVQIIAQALLADDLATIQRIAHNMKGSGSGYGFDKITEIGAAMQVAARAGQRQELRARMTDLSDFLNSLHAEQPLAAQVPNETSRIS